MVCGPGSRPLLLENFGFRAILLYRGKPQNTIENSSLFYQKTLLLEQVPLYLFSQIIVFAQKPPSKIGASSLCVPQHSSSRRRRKALGLPFPGAGPALLKFHSAAGLFCLARAPLCPLGHQDFLDHHRHQDPHAQRDLGVQLLGAGVHGNHRKDQRYHDQRHGHIGHQL